MGVSKGAGSRHGEPAVRRRLAAKSGAAALLIATGATQTPVLAQQVQGTPPPTAQVDLAQAAPPTATDTTVFDIPSQPLNSALLSFADTAGIQLFYDVTRLDGLTSRAVSGTLTPQEALAALLSGTGVTFSFTTPNTVTLQRAVVQEEGRPVQLGPVTVTATRFETPISDVPTAITIIDRDEIQTNPAFNRRIHSSLAQSIPGAGVPATRGTSVSIRGRGVSYRVNGVEINQRGRASDVALQDLSPSAFSSIEVVRGTDSTFGFGFDGGAINFRTPEPTPGAPEFTSSAGIDFQTEDLEESLGYSLRQEVTGTWNRLGYAIAGGGRFTGTQFDPDGDPYPDTETRGTTNAENFDINGAFTFQLDENQSLETTQYYFRSESDPEFRQGEPGDLETNLKARARPIGSDDFDLSRESALYVSTYTYRHENLWGNRLNLTGFYQFNDLSSAFDDPGIVGTFDEDNERYGLQSSVQTPLWFLDDTLFEGAAVTWGVDYQDYQYLRTAVRGPQPQNQTFAEVEEQLVAGHLQISLPLGDRVDLTGGVRHERGNVTLGDIDEDRPGGRGPFEGGDLDFDTTLFNGGITFHLTDQLNVYGSFSQSAGVLDFGRGSVLASRAEDLQPELEPTNQFELGVRGNFERWQVSLAAFRSESDLGQVFVLDPATGLQVPLPTPVEIWGAELTLDTQPLDNLGLGGTFSYSAGEIGLPDGSEATLTRLATQPPKLTGYIDYRPFDWWRNRLSVTHQFGTDQLDDFVATGQPGGLALDALTFVNFFARFEPGFVPGELDIGIENLLNTRETDIDAQGLPREDRLYLYPARTISLAYRLRW